MGLLSQTTESESEGPKKSLQTDIQPTAMQGNHWSNQQPIRFSDRNGILYTVGLRLTTREGCQIQEKPELIQDLFDTSGINWNPLRTPKPKIRTSHAVRIRFDLVHFEEVGPITLQLHRCILYTKKTSQKGALRVRSIQTSIGSQHNHTLSLLINFRQTNSKQSKTIIQTLR